MLLHAKKPELLEAFDRGHAFISRLDGEWSLRFSPEPVFGRAEDAA
jgi:hypothetical protein